MAVWIIRRLLPVVAVLAMVMGASVAPAPAAPMPAMAHAGHCADCRHQVPAADMKGMACAGVLCLGAVAVVPLPQALPAERFDTFSYSAAPLRGLIGRTLRPEPFPPKPFVQV